MTMNGLTLIEELSFMFVFLKGAENDDLESFLTKILKCNLHIIPGTTKKQGFTFKTDENHVKRDILLVPHATLAAKLKKGSNPQYHDQINKDLGKKLYEEFCEIAKKLLAEYGDEEAKVQCGTYGNRQGLKLETSGPNSHVFEF